MLYEKFWGKRRTQAFFLYFLVLEVNEFGKGRRKSKKIYNTCILFKKLSTVLRKLRTVLSNQSFLP